VVSVTQTTDRRLALVVVGALAALLLLPLLLGGGTMGYGPMMHRPGGVWGGGMWGGATASPGWVLVVGAVMRVAALAVVVGAGYLLYRTAVGDKVARGRDDALEELRLAYARGDLTDEEFERRRERLGGDATNEE
jgi:putative membrane protein